MFCCLAIIHGHGIVQSPAAKFPFRDRLRPKALESHAVVALTDFAWDAGIFIIDLFTSKWTPTKGDTDVLLAYSMSVGYIWIFCLL